MVVELNLSETQRSNYTINLSLINNDIEFIQNSFRGNNLNLKREIEEFYRIYDKEPYEIFLLEVANVCYKYGFSLCHEDNECGFLVREYDDDDVDLLLKARFEKE